MRDGREDDPVHRPSRRSRASVVDAVRAGDFWILPPDERTDERIHARADSMLKRENPTYVQATAG